MQRKKHFKIWTGFVLCVVLVSFCINFVLSANYSATILAGGDSLKEIYEDNAKEHGDGSYINFNANDQVFAFINKARSATNAVRMSTIGWQVRIEPNDGSTPFYTRVSFDFGREQVGDDGYKYTEYIVPVADGSDNSLVTKLADQFDNKGYDEDYFTTLLAGGVKIWFDAIISIKEAGTNEPNAIMNENGDIVPNPNAPKTNRGEYYLTKDGKSNASGCLVPDGWSTSSSYDKQKGGAKGARAWRDPSMFNDYFNKPTGFEPQLLVVEKSVYLTFRTLDGTELMKPMKGKTVEVSKGKSEDVTVTAISFPGYKLHSSALNYKGEGPSGDVSKKTGEGAATRTIKLSIDNEKHYVNFYYEKDETPGTGGGDGEILFTPYTSLEIPGNRFGWVNKDISVQVSVNESGKRVVMDGSQSRKYEYWDPYYDWHYETRTRPVYDNEGNYLYDEEYEVRVYDGAYVTSSASCGFTQTWIPAQLKVTGSGKNANGSTVSIGPFIISDGGTVSISRELKDVVLTASVHKWEPQSDQAYKAGSPPGGSWVDSKPTNNTSAPTQTYQSSSGQYFLDKTAPKIDSVQPQSTGWTNAPVSIDVSVSDNLSGFYQPHSYFVVADESYYNRTPEVKYFSDQSKQESANIRLRRDGIYSMIVSLEDIAENQMSQAIYGKYKIDQTNPYEASFSESYRNYLDEDLTVTVTVGDNLSGITETRYVVNNSPSDSSGMQNAWTYTAEGQRDYSSFTVHITQPGSWWIHVYQRDRAGNVTYSTSGEYKIVRLGNPNNRTGKTYTGLDKEFWVTPLQMNDKIPRGTRFDVHLETYGLSEAEKTNAVIHMEVPKWADDEVTKKVNGTYTVSQGISDIHTMIYYQGYSENSFYYGRPNTKLRWWKSFVAPFGTPATLTKNGSRLYPSYEMTVQLVCPDYWPNKTHPSTIQFDIVPETQMKTEITNNKY